jgi:hypothetical protein
MSIGKRNQIGSSAGSINYHSHNGDGSNGNHCGGAKTIDDLRDVAPRRALQRRVDDGVHSDSAGASDWMAWGAPGQRLVNAGR